MIQLYIPSNTNYSRNGNITLLPDDCEVDAILNGTWSASLSHPIDKDGRWRYLQEDAVVKMPSFNGDQLFRIKKVTKQDSGVKCTLEPIFYDAIDDCMIIASHPTNKNGQEALDIITAINPKYTGKSDITKTATAYYEYRNLLEAINGDHDNAFVKRWGGEVLYNNYEIVINQHIGGDYGAQLLYGRNIPKDGLKEEVDVRNVVTRIYPKSYNGYTISGNGFVDSEFIDAYPVVKAREMKFEDVKMASDAQENDAENGVIICSTQEELDAALTEKCKEQFKAGLDKPTVTISLEMVLLQNTELYKDFEHIETVSLGDTIHCKHNRLGIVTDARVIEITYDSIRKRAKSVKIGEFRQNAIEKIGSYFDKIDSVISPDGTLMGEKISGFIDGAMAMLKAQYNAAKKQDVMAVLFENLDEESDLYGALAMGTQGLIISKKRTEDGRSWDWTTALTANGLMANVIVAGILSDKEGKNYWDLDHSIFRLSADGFTIDDKTAEDYFKENWTQEEIFKKLTNNGASKGIWMEDGQLYINLTYCQAGTLVLGGPGNEHGEMVLLDVNGNAVGGINNGGAFFNSLSIKDRIMISDINDNYQVSIGFDQDTGNFYISGNALATYIQNIVTNSVMTDAIYAGALEAVSALINGDVDIEGNVTGLNGTMSYKNITAANMETNNFKAPNYAGTETRIESEKIFIAGYNGSYRPVGAWGAAGRRVGYLTTRGANSVYRLGINAQWDDTGTEDTAFSTKFITTNDSTSDVRLKENVKDCAIDAMELIRKIKMHQFDWKESGNHQQIGMIADELEELDSRLAYGGGYDNGILDPKQINTFYLMGYIVKALQEIDEKMTEMKGDNQ